MSVCVKLEDIEDNFDVGAGEGFLIYSVWLHGVTSSKIENYKSERLNETVPEREGRTEYVHS